METLAEQTLGEKCDKPSSEEDDQKNRSNKKIKPNEEQAGNEIEMVDHHVQGADNLTHPASPKSYCEVAMSMERCNVGDTCPKAMVAKPDSAMRVAFPLPEKSAQPVDENSAGILVSFGLDKDGDKIRQELTSRSSAGGEYGPWMLVQRPQHRNLRNRRDEKDPKSKGKESNRFHVLEQELHETMEATNETRDQRVMKHEHQVRKSHKQQKGPNSGLVKPKPKQTHPQKS
ncbi:hypothetical protein RIF29_24765 [Crotalaria pallida]|uniref:Uncharacterized protein n=1 Tax=Crotalaria pallida TaxID=3830 RepID=A0AAN9I0H1_CROPI